MAWSDTGDFTSGQILTAAAMDKVREAMFFGQATFTNEAARDTAFANPGALAPITLQEGMRAYLTAPTVPAATGASTSVPSGVTTIYNGSNWVCVSPVASTSNTVATTASTSYVTTLTGDATAVSTTLVTGTTALIQMFSTVQYAAAGAVGYISLSVSGATTIAASDANSAFANAPANGYNFTLGRVFVLTGLTAGTNTFTLNYKMGSSTSTWYSRNLVVQGIA
jgi:hypothetical protein